MPTVIHKPLPILARMVVVQARRLKNRLLHGLRYELGYAVALTGPFPYHAKGVAIGLCFAPERLFVLCATVAVAHLGPHQHGFSHLFAASIDSEYPLRRFYAFA